MGCSMFMVLVTVKRPRTMHGPSTTSGIALSSGNICSDFYFRGRARCACIGVIS